jgi:uncharacterized delta-60 repeat protein
MTKVKYDRILCNLRESDEPHGFITRHVLGTNVLTDDMLMYSGSQVIKEEDWLTYDDRESNSVYLSEGSKYAKLKYYDNGVFKDIPASLGFSYKANVDAALTSPEGVFAPFTTPDLSLVSDFDNATGLYTFYTKSGIRFNTNIAGVNKLLLQPDDKIIAVGNFQGYQGKTTNSIVRINPNGSRDYTFDMGVGFDQAVNDAVLLPSGKIICVGIFTKYNDVDAHWIVCLNSDGSIDTSFTTNLGAGIVGAENGYIRTIKLSNGSLYVCGWTININGVITKGFGKLAIDGTPDAAYNSNIAAIPHEQVRNFDTYPDGKVILAGSFTITTEKNVVRLVANGTVDGTFTPLYQTSIVQILILQSGDLLCGGPFNSWGGSNITVLGKISSTGVQNTTWKISGLTIMSTFQNVNLLKEFSDGRIMFTHDAIISIPSLATQRGVTVLNADGSANTAYHIPQFDNGGANAFLIPTVLFLPNGKMIFGGNFVGIYGIRSHGIIQLNADYSTDTTNTYPWLNVSSIGIALVEVDGVLCLVSNSALGISIFNFLILQQYGTGNLSLGSGASS